MTSHLPSWFTVLSGAGCGLLWGIGARIWMRLISTNPEFSIEGTAYILIVATLFGAGAGLAFSARQRAWVGWRQYVSRSLAIIFFLPFGVAGGVPLMLTMLIFTLGITQSPIIGLWVVTGLTLLLRLATDISIPQWVAGILLISTVGFTVWTWLIHKRPDDRLQFVNMWFNRVARLFLIVLALIGVGIVAWDIMSNHAIGFAVLYMLFYLVLLYPLFWGLRVALAPTQNAHIKPAAG